MLYETLSQGQVLIWVVICGFSSGLIYDIATFLFILCDKNKIVRHILDFVSTLLVCLILFVLILNISYGELRIWHILCFTASILLERATIGKLVAKILFRCYNFLIKKIRKFSSKLSKLKVKTVAKKNNDHK